MGNLGPFITRTFLICCFPFPLLGLRRIPLAVGQAPNSTRNGQRAQVRSTYVRYTTLSSEPRTEDTVESYAQSILDRPRGFKSYIGTAAFGPSDGPRQNVANTANGSPRCAGRTSVKPRPNRSPALVDSPFRSVVDARKELHHAGTTAHSA